MTTPSEQYYNNPNKGDFGSNSQIKNGASSNSKPQVSANSIGDTQKSQLPSNQYQSQPQFQPQPQQLQQQTHSSKQSVQLQQPVQQLPQQLPKQNQPQIPHSRESSHSPNKSFASSSLDRPLYNPQTELQGGKSEEDVLNKLKLENAKLRKELKSISDDLTVLLEKKKTKKVDKPTQYVKDIVSNVGISEQGLRSELENAYKQLERLQKELSSLKGKYDSEATYSKYQELEENLRTKEARVDQLQGQKKILDKKVRDHEKILDALINEAESNSKVNNLAEEARLLRERIKEAERKKESNDKQAQNKKDYITKVSAELNELKKEFSRVQQITKFEPPQEKPVAQKNTEKVIITPKNGVSTAGRKSQGLEFNEENYEKLKKEWKILKKAQELRSRMNKYDVNTLHDDLDNWKKMRVDKEQKIAEKVKEISILNSKLKDLGRIVRHQAVAPLQSKELETNTTKETSQDAIRTSDLRTSLIKREAYNASRVRNGSKLKKDASSPKKLQPNHLLVEYANKNFQSKGYRKDEKGKPVSEEEGVNFNDKDVVGKQRVKIIALDVWHDEQKINGIQAVYENDKGDVIEGGPHVVNPDKSKIVTFETLEEDHIKEISGFTDKNETTIQCLILRTFRGETMKIGQPHKDGKLFKFDINELEYPAVIFGSIIEGQNGDGRLARLGVLITSETVEERLENNARKEEMRKKEEEEKKEKEEAEKREKEATISSKDKSLGDVKSQGSLKDGSKGLDSKDEIHREGQAIFNGKNSEKHLEGRHDGEEEQEDQEEQGDQEDQAEVGGYEDADDGEDGRTEQQWNENNRQQKTDSSSPVRS